MVSSANIKYFIGIVSAILLVWIYKSHDPAQEPWFPKCVFKYMTGYDCPGCGSQRAFHALLNLDIPSAFKINPLVVIAIPYLLLFILITAPKEPGKWALKCRRLVYGPIALYLVCAIVISFWVLRNVATL